MRKQRVSDGSEGHKMPDRLQEIRARLDAATPEWNYDNDQSGADVDLINHAPSDIAWLLDEVERLRNTKVSATQPLCDEPVVQGVTKLECSDAE